MDIGMIGLGRMGANMTQRLIQGGHRVVVTDLNPQSIAGAVAHGAIAAPTLDDMVAALPPRRAIWMMVPAGQPVQHTVDALASKLSPGDVLVDGGNSNYHDSIRRAEQVRANRIEYVDAGVSGGIWGLHEGFCLMVGGSSDAFAHLEPALRALAPVDGYAHVGPSGAGHFAKMIHNGIEYAMIAAYGEGFELLDGSPFDFDLHRIAALWNRGSVVRSWLLELTERALEHDPHLERIRGYIEDSGEGRWTVQEAIDRGVPLPVITLSLMGRFASRQETSFAAKMQAALRNEFGGHAVRAAGDGATPP